MGGFSMQNRDGGGGSMSGGEGPSFVNEDIPGDTNAPACCDEDDYVELYNTANTEIAVQSSDGSSGWALVKRGASCVDPPVVVAVIPNGAIIPARGHYLLTGSEYSLSGYAGESCCVTATPDQTLNLDINDNRSVGLFNTSNPANFDPAHRLDAVGIDAGSGGTCDLLSEGTKLLAPRGSTDEWAFVPGRGTVQVRGLRREEPPDQGCGGLNTSLSEDQTTPITPLAPGASIDVVFRVGVVQPGTFRFFVSIEALP